MSSTTISHSNIQHALIQPSHLDLEALYSAGVKLKEIERVATDILNEKNVESNVKFIKEWASKHKKSPEKSLLDDIFHTEQSKDAKKALEFYLNAGGSAKKIVRFLSKTPLPLKTKERVTFLANLRVAAEIKIVAPSKKAFFKKKTNPDKIHSSLVAEWNKHASTCLDDPEFLTVAFQQKRKGLFTALISSTHHATILKWLFEGELKTRLPFYLESGGKAKNLSQYLQEQPETPYWLVNTWFVLKQTQSPEIRKIWNERKASHNVDEKTFIDSQHPDGGQTLLYNAVVNQDIETIKRLIELGADAEIGTVSGNKPLHVAANLGNQEMVELLLDAGAEINGTNNTGLTPLHFLLFTKRASLVPYLVKKGADLNASNSAGHTPLHYSAKFLGKETTDYLISKGADPLSQQRTGKANAWSSIIEFSWQPSLESYFSDYPLITKACDSIEQDKRLIYIRHHAEELLQTTNNTPKLIPLEVAFLLEDPKTTTNLIKAMARNSDLNTIEQSIAHLKEKYPQSSFKMIDDALKSVLEAPYEVSKEHVLSLAGVVSLTPTSDDNADVSLDKLSAMLQNVLSIPKGQPGYRDLTFVRDANGNSFTADELKQKMQRYISDIKTRQAKPGTPPAEKPALLEAWYSHLEALAKGIIAKLEEENLQATADDPVPNAASLFELALAGGHCGGWNMGETQKIYQQKCQQDFPDLPTQILQTLHTLHQSTVESMIARDNPQNTHLFNMIMQLVDESAGIKNEQKKDRFYFLDTITPLNRETIKPEILMRYWGNYEPTSLINSLEHTLNIEHAIDTEVLLDWFKEHVPESWKKEKYQKALDAIKSPISTKDQLTLLSKDHEIDIQLKPTIEKQLEDHFLRLKDPEKYKKAVMNVAAFRRNLDLAVSRLATLKIHVTKDKPLLEQVNAHFMKELDQENLLLYRSIQEKLKTMTSDEEKAKYLQKDHGIRVLVPKTIEEEIKEQRRSEFLGEVLNDRGHFNRNAIIYLLKTLGILKKRDDVTAEKKLFRG